MYDIPSSLNLTVADIFNRMTSSQQDKPAVKMGKYWAWWLWRGYATERGSDIQRNAQWTIDGWRWGKNLTDDRNYDPLASFPVFRPRFDVFGVPPRSRKQRGWYQIIHHTPRPSDCKTITQFASTDATCRKNPALAADLPEEIFEEILKQVKDTYDEQHLSTPKRQLSTCAQVCTYWAKICRRKLFEHVLLGSLKDIWPLHEFQNTPDCPLAPIIVMHVTISEQSLSHDSPPWLYHIPAIFGNRIDEARHGLVLKGPLPRRLKTIRSI